MKIVGSFNKVSEKLKEELIPTVKRGEVVHFQLLNGSYDPSAGRECFGASKSIRLMDTIYDPYAKKNEKGEYIGEYVEIGVPADGGIKEGRVERVKKFWVESIANGIPGNGQFHFTGGDISQMEIFEFLCLSNGSSLNPHRDTSKPATHTRIDVEANLRKEKDKDKKELENKLRRFAKQYPDEAKEFEKIIAGDKNPATT